MFDEKALRHAMLDADCSARELAQVCGLSPAALYRRFSGEVFFNVGEIEACASRLRLTPGMRNNIFFCFAC